MHFVYYFGTYYIPVYSFAFVEFEDRRDAEDAFEKFDGFSVEGRRLRLDWYIIFKLVSLYMYIDCLFYY
ncbi:MAG: hypothetical protein JSY10_20740 [Paenibacillus sp.]|nr:hypothetical protein [Paenibacillus sp.]